MLKTKVNFNLPVVVFKEGSDFIAYSPSVDISTVGTSFAEAQRRFEEIVDIFFEELSEMGTLEDVLTNLGWTKENKQLVPPLVVSNQMRQFSFDKPPHPLYA